LPAPFPTARRRTIFISSILIKTAFRPRIFTRHHPC
jgi:hypothetical protein